MIRMACWGWISGYMGAPETFFIDSKGIIPLSPRGDINPENWASTLKPIFDAMK